MLTLHDLLGNETRQTEADNYERRLASNDRMSSDAAAMPRGDMSFDKFKYEHRMQSAPINVEPMRFDAQLMDTPMAATREPRMQGDPYMRGAEQGYVNDAYYQAPNARYGYSQGYMPQSSLYDYTAQQESMARARELDSKLGVTEQYSRTESRQEEQTAPHARTRRKLERKSKLIIGLYVAVVITVITLIAVNAGKINSGKAVVPASSFTAIEQPID